LDGGGEHFSGLDLRRFPGLFLEAHGNQLGFAAGLDFHLSHELALGFLGGESGDTLELSSLLLERIGEAGLVRDDGALSLYERTLTCLGIRLTPIQLIESPRQLLRLTG